MSPARARTRTTQSQDERSNHGPPCLRKVENRNSIKISNFYSLCVLTQNLYSQHSLRVPSMWTAESSTRFCLQDCYEPLCSKQEKQKKTLRLLVLIVLINFQTSEILTSNAREVSMQASRFRREIDQDKRQSDHSCEVFQLVTICSVLYSTEWSKLYSKRRQES